MKRVVVLCVMSMMILAAIPTNGAAQWVEPIPGSKTDDVFWHVTFDFESWWEATFDAYDTGSSNREPTLAVYDDKLWILWEGLLVPSSPEEPIAYKGKLYLRSFTDRSGEPEWSDIIDVTPNAYYSDHTNQKGIMVPYKGKLYVFWQSDDRNQKPTGYPDHRFDILMRSYDGNDMLKMSTTEVVSRTGPSDESGYDQIPQATVYKDKLYVIWFREDINLGISDILYRSFDGTLWSDIKVLSKFPNNDTRNLGPAISVWKDRLYVMWQQMLKGGTTTEAVYSYTENGNTWTGTKALSRPIDKSSVAIDLLCDLATYDNPVTGKTELHAFWRTYKEEATHGGFYDFDIVTRIWDGTSWSQTQEVSLIYDEWDDTLVDAIQFGGQLYIFWSSRDNSVADGKDYDIILRKYDGTAYSSPLLISRLGDRDDVLFDDNEWWNKGDDIWPRAAIYESNWGEDRLFVTWWTFDHITGCCADAPDDAHPTITLRMVEDSDYDKDGHPDSKDDCPTDPNEYKDTDGDGVCDDTDWDPEDPDIWLKPEGGDEDEGMDPLMLYIILVVLFIAAVALMAYRGEKKKPRPAGPRETDEEE